MSSRWGLPCILLVALVLRVFYFSGMTGYDEFAYVHIAWNMLMGVFEPAAVEDYFGLRYPLLVPVAALFAAFGVGPLAAAIVPLCASLGNVGVAHSLGRTLGPSGAGLVAALLHAVFPLSVVYGTVLYPEELIGLLSGLAVLFFLRAQGDGDRARSRWALGSGVVMGLAAWLRPTALALALLLALVALVSRQLGALLWTGAGVALVLGLEGGLHFLLVGDPLHAWRVNFARVAADAETFSTDMWVYPLAMLGGTRYGLGVFGLFFPITAGAVALMAWRERLKRAWVPLLWLGILFAFFQFASTSLFAYRPLHRQFRFLSVLILPAVLLLGIFVMDLWRGAGLLGRWDGRGAGKLLAGVVVVTLVVSSLGAAWMLARYRAERVAPYKWVAGLVAKEPGLPVYVPQRDWLHFLPFFLREEGTLREPFYPRFQRASIHRLHLWSHESVGQATGGFVLVDRGREPAPGVSARGLPPTGVAPVGVRGNLFLYRLPGPRAPAEDRAAR